MIKKRRPIDSVDREIIRSIHGAMRPLSGHQISQKINLSPPAIKPRLISLKNRGIIKPINIGSMRTFKRTFGQKIITINAPSRIRWDLDLTTRKSNKKRKTNLF